MSKQYEIHQRIFLFIVRGLRVPSYLPKTIESKIIIDQYLRSLTSVGANDNEADGTTTKKDFIHCYVVVRKELKEAHYWLRIISEVYPSLMLRLLPLIKENDELIRIVSSIITKTTNHL